MSVVVTAPNSRPDAPALAVHDDRLGLQRVAHCLGVVERRDLARLAGLADRGDLLLRTLGPAVARPRGSEVVAGVAVLDLDDVTGRTEAGDLVGEDELCIGPASLSERSSSTGSRAISRAFLTARAISRCSWTETPVTRRARILPRSEMNLRSSAVSL